MSQGDPNTQSELIEFIRSIDVSAPEGLHRRTGALVAERSARRRGPGTALLAPGWRLGGAVAILAATVLALALIIGRGSSAPLTVGEASALTLRPATMLAPAESRSEPAHLTAAMDGISFPYWEESFGWRSTGARVDRIGGRSIMTVFYTDTRGRRVGYAIVGGTPAPLLSGGTVVWRGSTPYRLLVADGSQFVLWLRDGHLCIVAGRGVSASTLLGLAS